MAYERVNWENLPSTKTPVNADNLNKMENGIAEIDKTNEVSTINFVGWNSTYPCHADRDYVYINVPRGKLKEGNISMNNTGLHFWNWSGQTRDVTFSGLAYYKFTTTELILMFPISELDYFDTVMCCFTEATIITST